jgi:hypothetical protein
MALNESVDAIIANARHGEGYDPYDRPDAQVIHELAQRVQVAEEALAQIRQLPCRMHSTGGYLFDTDPRKIAWIVSGTKEDVAL